MPQLFAAPTGWLLPAAVLYSRTGLDTGGNFTTDERIGLGDVAELGLATLSDVRAKASSEAGSSSIQPYVAASFRVGIAEDRLFDDQPGLVIGFRKSFERTSDGFSTRVAELTLVASKHIGSRLALHVGGAIWDASIDGNGPGQSRSLSDGSFSGQLAAYGGLEVKPFARSEILVDWAYAPEFCYACTGAQQIQLQPELSWGVRYKVAPWLFLESGVHVFDIASAKLLDAQIFGQITFATWGLRHAVDDLR